MFYARVPWVVVLGFLLGFYGLFVLVALTNLALMRRAAPSRQAEWNPAVLIPARNEAHQIAEAVRPLVEQGAKVYVFDDESTDGTAEVAADAGAVVIRSREPLPEGWVGKNRACHELAKAAAEDHAGEWMVYLDADVKPGPTFVASLGTAVLASKKSVATGFPRLIPGKGLEPAYLGWVTWILGASNPFGLVTLAGAGHNRFMNGQLGIWKSSLYFELLPHEAVKGEVLEDVKIGRLLAAKGVPVAVLDVSSVLAVAMYKDFREALDGMSKNTYSITGSAAGTLGLGVFFLFAAWGWALAGPLFWAPLGLLLLSKLLVDRLGRTPLWTLPLMPITLTLAAYTCVRSLVWKRQGRVVWKGRTYS